MTSARKSSPEPGDVVVERSRIRWRPCYRIIPSRFPAVDLFARIAPPDDWGALNALESLTNDRFRDESGAISIVPAGDRVMGPGSGYIMAAFTHVSRGGGRFHDASVGAYYAGRTLATSVAESRHHRENFLRATNEPPIQLDMRVLEADIDARFHDIRGMRDTLPDVYHLSDYSAGQTLAARLRADGSDGVAYDSVRHENGECIAIFSPRRIRNCHASLHLAYVWDGSRIADVYEMRPLTGL